MRTVVVGGGIVGLSAAWRLASRGVSVTVVDPAPATAATRAAAGMLAPVSEVQYGEERLLALGVESLRRYPEFVAELEAATGRDVGLRRDGTLVVATDAGDRAVLAELHEFQQRLGLSSQLLTSRECRRLEPMLAPGIRSGLFVEGDFSIDNRRLAAALLEACAHAGVELVADRAREVTVAGGAATGIRTDGGHAIPADVVVVAAGPWSSQLHGLPADVLPVVRPVKGQILRLRGPVVLDRTVRALVNGGEVYLVPRADGELVVGATVEEMGFDTTVRAGASYELLRDARTAVPGIDELALVETTAALRPGSPDNAPVVGRTAVDGLVVATGHHRNGILLTPVTADLVAACVLGTGADEQWLQVTSPRRFEAVPA